MRKPLIGVLVTATVLLAAAAPARKVVGCADAC